MTDEQLSAMIGQRYGARVVLSIFSRGNHKRGAQLITRCDCGYTGRASARALLKGLATNCGCHNMRNTLPLGEAALNALIRLYSERADKRGLVWDLTRDFVRNIIAQPCHYCGVPPFQICRSRYYKGKADLLYNGIDRIDSAQGYTPGNVVACCGPCNRMKSDTPYQIFLARCRAIVERHGRQPV